ncbi:MAG: CaiB/BaiF CoA-transferase family protein [Pseudomonadota bacterium]
MIAPLPEDARPLAGLLVVDFSQFLSGPLCGLKLADLGARVIKIERPGTGDLCRHLYISPADVDGDNTLFHAINRNKESFVADLRDETDCTRLRNLLARADVMIQNFRPGVIDRRGFGYEDVRKINPRLVYGSITGYGEMGPWRDLPGQDLLAQARAGLLWLTGSRDDPPIPMGLAVADMLAGHTLATGILAALVGRSLRGEGCHVSTSLLEVLIDFQFEVLTTYFNDGEHLPQRAAVGGAHAYLNAPYGVYETSDGYLAIAMTPSLKHLGELLDIENLPDNPPFTKRDELKAILAKKIRTRTTEQWLKILQAADIWCAEVRDWPSLLRSHAFKELDFLQTITRAKPDGDDVTLTSLRAPIRINDQVLKSTTAAPLLGEHTAAITSQFSLDQEPDRENATTTPARSI